MSTHLVGYGVNTLILNVRYADEHGQPVEAEREEQLLTQLDYLQKEARQVDNAQVSPWSFLSLTLLLHSCYI